MTAGNSVHDRFSAVAPDRLPTRRVAVFLAVTFGLNWLPAAYFLTEGVTFGDRNLSTVAYNVAILFASFSPAVGHVVTRWVTDEGFGRDEMLLPVETREHWREYALMAVGPLVLTVVGVAVYFALYPEQLVAHPLDVLASSGPLSFGGRLGTAGALFVMFVVTVLGVFPGALIVFGEEFGWRAYLLPKLVPLGRRTATVLTGIIWGVWHWPYVLLGLNFGLDYPGGPWLGLLAMVWVPTLYGTALAWATFRTGSVWPAAVGHVAFNTSARWGPRVAEGTPNLALGPTTGGLIASAGWVVVAVWLLTRAPIFERDSPGAVDRRAETADES